MEETLQLKLAFTGSAGGIAATSLFQYNRLIFRRGYRCRVGRAHRWCREWTDCKASEGIRPRLSEEHGQAGAEPGIRSVSFATGRQRLKQAPCMMWS